MTLFEKSFCDIHGIILEYAGRFSKSFVGENVYTTKHRERSMNVDVYNTNINAWL